MSISRLGKPCAILVAFVAANAAAVVIQNKDVLGRTLQYDELDRESLSNIFWQLFLYHTVWFHSRACGQNKTGTYAWMHDDDDLEHPVNGKYSSYLPSDLSLNTELEIDEDDRDSECRVEHK